jgi:flagellar assembly factor FliW
MPQIDTTHFGRISYQEDAVFLFPAGLPGFEQAREFLPLSFPDTQPLIFLQSMEDPGLCFIALPVLAADPSYRLEMSEEDIASIGLPAGSRPRIGEEVLCLAVLSLRESGPTANLMAPIVVNLRTRRSVQAIAQVEGYSHQQPLVAASQESQAAAC